MNFKPNLLRVLASELEKAGVTCDFLEISTKSGFDGLLDVSLGDSDYRFVVQIKSRPPFRSELEKLFALSNECRRHGTPLLLAPTVGASQANELSGHGWSWADELGNYDLRAPGFCWRQVGRVADVPPPQQLPGGLAGTRLIRWLIAGLGQDPARSRKNKDIARQLGVSPPAVSRISKQLRQLGFIAGTRLSEVDREGLLHAFIREYRGAGGHIEYAFTLDSLGEFAQGLEATQGNAIALSADVGPDRIAPWRVPTTLIVYVKDPQLHIPDLVPAEGPGDANVLLHFPDDMSVFQIPGSPRREQPTLADPTQMLIDLHRLGGDDRLEAAEKLEQWLLK